MLICWTSVTKPKITFSGQSELVEAANHRYYASDSTDSNLSFRRLKISTILATPTQCSLNATVSSTKVIRQFIDCHAADLVSERVKFR